MNHQQLTPQPGFNYIGQWGRTDVLCGPSSEKVNVILSELITAYGCAATGEMRLTAIFRRNENALYQIIHVGEIVVAQTEIRFQDGTCPPHVVIHTKIKK